MASAQLGSHPCLAATKRSVVVQRRAWCISSAVFCPHTSESITVRGLPHLAWHQCCRGHTRQHVMAQAAQQASSEAMHLGVVVVDHGSRKRDSNDQLVHFGLMYQQLTGAPIVEIAHMEIAEPTIEQAIDKCVAAGARKIVVAPYFLSKGRHIQEDIPALVKDAQAKHPGIECVVADPIGLDPLMVQLIHNRVQAAVGAGN